MDHVHRLQRINAYPGQIDGPSRSEQHSWSTVTISPKTRADRSRSSSLQSYYTAPYAFTPPYVPSPPSVPTPPNAPSPPHGRTSHASYQSYYSANTSPMSYISTNTSSTLSSTLSSYSVASINSYKSRKTVLYPRRAHPPPVIVALEHSVSPEVCYFCFFLSLLLNTGATSLRIGLNLANPVPLYNLIAIRRDPPDACWKCSPPVIGASRRFFATLACY